MKAQIEKSKGVQSTDAIELSWIFKSSSLFTLLSLMSYFQSIKYNRLLYS